jgi:hypothetical protein
VSPQTRREKGEAAAMIITEEGLPFIADYISEVNEGVKKLNKVGLSRLQCVWLRFVLLGMLLTNSLCWSRFARFGLGEYSAPALGWLFRRAKIMWEVLLSSSVSHIINKYGIRSGKLVVDDTDNERSKSTTKIAKVHKIKDKRTGGYCNGQNIVFLVLVSKELTIPVGFKFFEPDPELRKWRIQCKKLRSEGVAKEDLPMAPTRNPQNPKKTELALSLIEDFATHHPEIKIEAITADALYGTKEFMDRAQLLISRPQVISQIAKTQLINVGGKYIQAHKFFEDRTNVKAEVMLRGSATKIEYCSGMYKVKAQGKKCWVIALRYEGETEYRYLIATDMTWNDIDVIKAYSIRWLVEVFIQDWKSYEGWAQLAKQRGIDGSNHGVILSLLCDHMLYFHEANLALFKEKKPAVTVGSLRDKIMIESLMSFVEGIVKSDNPKKLLSEFTDKAAALFELRESKKHLRHHYEEAPWLENT